MTNGRLGSCETSGILWNRLKIVVVIHNSVTVLSSGMAKSVDMF